MEGIDIRELVSRRGTGFRGLVEAVIDHELCPEDPLTDSVRKGAQGVAYDFWECAGNWWRLAIAVAWEPGIACNYIETYRRRDKVRKPITEIRFVRALLPDEQLPETNPLYVHNNNSWP